MTKRKVSVSLDEDLVEEIKREDESLSVQANAAASAELERRNRLLVELLDRLDAEHGPVDEFLVAKYVGLLAVVRLLDGTTHTAEIHWYEAHGLGRKEIKLKLPLLD